MAELALVLGFRNRDLERVKLCLSSLAAQTFQDFEVIFVDYGSDLGIARSVQDVVERYEACKYIYSDSRGQPWNRARALNIGARVARARYLMTSDIDMVFPTLFLETVMREAGEDLVLYCSPGFLPQGFDDWGNLDAYATTLPIATRAGMGGCQCVSMKAFLEIRGFDEYFRYWGAEDTDIHDRLILLGMREEWLTDRAFMFHQWHVESNFKTRGFMPDGLWGRMEEYRLHNGAKLVRNSERWGRVVCTEERRVLDFVDLVNGRLQDRKDLHWFDERPDNNRKLGDFVERFWSLSPGHAMAVNHASFPYRRRSSDILLRGINWITRRTGAGFKVDYSHNLLHSFLDEFIERNEEQVVDYYLGFPVRNGVSVLVRA